MPATVLIQMTRLRVSSRNRTSIFHPKPSFILSCALIVFPPLPWPLNCAASSQLSDSLRTLQGQIPCRWAMHTSFSKLIESLNKSQQCSTPCHFSEIAERSFFFFCRHYAYGHGHIPSKFAELRISNIAKVMDAVV